MAKYSLSKEKPDLSDACIESAPYQHKSCEGYFYDRGCREACACDCHKERPQ